MERLLTPAEAAEILNVGRSHVYDLMTFHGLPFVLIGKHGRRIRPDKLQEWIESRSAARPVRPDRRVKRRG